nr:cytochrome P-450 27/25-hydroxylase=52 kda isoform [rats, Sprague-Dawley, liver, Peptide Mitochondrial Partial, 10 aa] [Rattus sp.]
AIPAALRDHE